MPEKSGIAFEAAHVSMKKRRQQPSLIAECVALLLFVLGGVIILHFTVRTPLNLPVYAAAVIGAVAVPVILHLKERWKVLGLVIAGLAAAAFLSREEWIRGARCFYMEWIDAVNLYFHTQFYAEYVQRDEGALTALMILGICAAACAVGIAITCWKSYSALLLAELPLGWMGINLLARPLIAGLAPLALSFFMVYAMECGTLHSRSRPHSRRIRPPGHAQEAALKGGLSVLIMGLAVMLGIGALAPRESYSWNEALMEFHQNPSAALERFSPDRLSGSTVHQGISGGYLGRADKVDPLGELQLQIIDTDQAVPMYLRGYTGSVYQGDRWTELEQSAYAESRALFDALEAADCPALTLSGDFNSRFLAGTGGEPVLNTLTIRNVKANPRYLYIPYQLYSTPGNSPWRAEHYLDDGMMADSSLRQGDSYTLQAYLYPNGFQEAALGDSRSLWEQYRSSAGERAALMEEYGEFARKWYTRLPEEGLERLRQDYTPERAQGLSPDQWIAIVREGLSGCRYDLAPGRTPAGEDFAEHFLYESRRGYCTHFASAATLMFRAMGIPARYVEGYLVRAEDYRDGQADVRDRNAHAWTEIYLEPWGWVPVEVTPGAEGGQAAPVPVAPESSQPESAASSQPEPSRPEPSAPMQSSSAEGSRPAGTSISESSGIGSEGSGGFSPEISRPDEPPAETLPDWATRLLILLGSVFGGLLLAGAAIYWRRRLLLARRERSFTQRNRNRAALAAYAYLLRLLKLEGLLPGGKDPMDFAARAAENPLVERAGDGFGIEQAAAAALEARFSGRTISPEKLADLLGFVRRLEQSLWQSRKGVERLRLYWISPLLAHPEGGQTPDAQK